MSVKRLVIYVVIAIAVGVIMGAISRFWNLDLDIFPFVIPAVFFISASGTDAVISKKNKEKK